MTTSKQPSRMDRWLGAASAAYDAVEQLLEIQQEYQDWLDNLPESLQQSATGEKLQAVCDLDIDGALSTLDDAQNMDLPLGFGRD